jgi:Type II secretion system (T2SS), protein G
MSWKLLLVTMTAASFAGGLIGSVFFERSFCNYCPGVRSHTVMVMHDVDLALVHYQTENTDSCPRSLSALVEQRFLATTPLDAWGQPLWFVCPGVHDPDGADLISAGPDHMFGTADDIKSWEL